MLRARVVAGQSAIRDLGHLSVHREIGSDTEVEDLRFAFRCDEDVRGLQIAMGHQLLVHEVHGPADGGEEHQPPFEVELVLPAVVGKG